METQTMKKEQRTFKDVHQIVNDKIVDNLEKGIVPWRTSWLEAGMPTNLNSKKAYRGINLMLLATLGYKRNVFITENQLEDVRGSIMANENPHLVVFWSNGLKAGEAENGTIKKPSKLSYYQVYNIEQCAGISGELVPEAAKEADPISACESIVAGIGKYPALRHKDEGTFYDPLEDYINIPKLKSFANPACYYSQLFHQLAHSTGHHTRLDRMGLVQMPEYGCNAFTMEELVAEIVTNYLENVAGIPCPFEPGKEYIDGWIERLKADRYLIFTATTLAQKAIDYILNVKETKDE